MSEILRKVTRNDVQLSNILVNSVCNFTFDNYYGHANGFVIPILRNEQQVFFQLSDCLVSVNNNNKAIDVHTYDAEFVDKLNDHVLKSLHNTDLVDKFTLKNIIKKIKKNENITVKNYMYNTLDVNNSLTILYTTGTVNCTKFFQDIIEIDSAVFLESISDNRKKKANLICEPYVNINIDSTSATISIVFHLHQISLKKVPKLVYYFDEYAFIDDDGNDKVTESHDNNSVSKNTVISLRSMENVVNNTHVESDGSESFSEDLEDESERHKIVASYNDDDNDDDDNNDNNSEDDDMDQLNISCSTKQK